MKVTLDRTDDAFHFVGRNPEGLETHFDTSTEEGGAGSAPGPMQTVAMALGACSGIDIVIILNKARQDIESFRMEIDYDRADESVPRVFTRMHVHYALTGDLDVEKVRRAVELSLEKYCSVAGMLEKTASISHSFSVNGKQYE